jgi:hypothetical protein
MGTDDNIKEENTPCVQGNDGGNNYNNRRGGRRTRNRWNNATAGGTPSSGNKFKSRNKDLPDDLTFNNTGPNDAANFQHALRGITDFLYTTYSADVADTIRTMKDVVITIPKPPTRRTDSAGNDIPVSPIDEYIWKEDYKEQLAKKRLYDSSMPKAYIHIYNQCSTKLKNDLGTSSAYPTVDTAKDPIALLKLIQRLCCSNDSKTQSVMATIASHKLLFT